jgi:hypothetical protein
MFVVQFINEIRVLIFNTVEKVSSILQVLSIFVYKILSFFLPGSSICSVLIFLTLDCSSMVIFFKL